MFAIHSLYHAVHRRFKLNFTSKTKLVHKRRTDIRLHEANKHTTPLSPLGEGLGVRPINLLRYGKLLFGLPRVGVPPSSPVDEKNC